MKARIVLVRPRNPLNIGAAARALANFGLDDLVVVAPHEPIWRETTSAVGAEALLLKARALPTLEEALADCQLVLGTTTARNRQLNRPMVALPNLRSYLKKRGAGPRTKIALLFGSEKTGLSTESLERCHAYLTIPTAPAQPSLNLSHAVALCCYELAKGVLRHPGQDVPLLTAADRERLVGQILQLFGTAGYLERMPQPEKTRKVHQTLLQWNLRASDARMLQGIIRYLMKR